MTQKIHCLIVDDDPIAINLVADFVEKTDSLELIYTGSDTKEATSIIAEHPNCILFLDVEMPDISGLELVKTLSQKPEIIIISGKRDYALDAFDLSVTDFLLKPLEDYNRFLQAVQRAQKNLRENIEKEIDNIFVKIDSLLVNFNLNEILWIEAFGDYAKIHTEEKTYTFHSTLKNVEDKLPKKEFMRVHRSYIVRMDKIKSINVANLQISNKIIPISHTYKGDLMKKINTL